MPYFRCRAHHTIFYHLIIFQFKQIRNYILYTIQSTVSLSVTVRIIPFSHISVKEIQGTHITNILSFHRKEPFLFRIRGHIQIKQLPGQFSEGNPVSGTHIYAYPVIKTMGGGSPRTDNRQAGILINMGIVRYFLFQGYLYLFVFQNPAYQQQSVQGAVIFPQELPETVRFFPISS